MAPCPRLTLSKTFSLGVFSMGKLLRLFLIQGLVIISDDLSTNRKPRRGKIALLLGVMGSIQIKEKRTKLFSKNYRITIIIIANVFGVTHCTKYFLESFSYPLNTCRVLKEWRISYVKNVKCEAV